MALHLADSLLALAASIEGDGGHAVCRTLAALLRDMAPFDAGEVVLREERGFQRFPFGADEKPVVGDDVVDHVLKSRASVRLDDARDLEAFPETRDRMAESGSKSALVLPLGTVLHVPSPPHGASTNGVLALSRRHGWAFVGASLNFLGPLAAMAGLALDRSLALTARGRPREAEPPQPVPSSAAASDGEAEALRARLAAVRDELADARGAAIAAQSALDQAVGRCRELQARLDEAAAARRATERGGAEEERDPREAERDRVEQAPEVAPAPSDDRRAPENEAAAATSEPVGALGAAGPRASRRSRRRKRGAFEPPGGTGAA